MNTIYASPVCEMEELKDIFIELSAKNCNVRCRECYIDFPFTKNVKDFIKIDTVKTALKEVENNNIRTIYLTGAEPMTHPDFNTILRLCIRVADVCICTNASFINEKKSRFLKSVETDSKHQIFFKLSFAHWDEMKNDVVRSRGAYRQNIYAIKCLDKYGFTNILSIANYYNEPHNRIITGFREKMEQQGIDNAIIQITEWTRSKQGLTGSSEEGNWTLDGKTDCMTSRTLTENGIFSCPFLANDYRGRVGSDFSNYSKSIRLETDYCQTCLKNKDKMFSVELEG